MIDAGLGSLPGGGAEIFHPEVRDKICEHKADAERWLDIHRTAHRLGLRSNATMLYGHLENAYASRSIICVRLRELQDETGGFQTFIPLAFHPDNTRLGHITKASRHDGPADDRRQPADARQLRRTSRPTGSCSASARPRWRWATAPTTWTARCATS